MDIKLISEKKIGMVILNYNDAKTVENLWNKIHSYKVIDHMIIVDNLSPDDSYSRLKKLVTSKVDVIQTDHNGGYSYGNNFGAFFLINKYQPDILFIANPDVQFSEEFLIQIVHDMIKEKAQAACGYMALPKDSLPIRLNPQINSFWDEALSCTYLVKKIFPHRGRFIKQGTGIQKVEWIPGSLFAIEANVYNELGGLDERVFLYYEEQILGKKFLDHGYKMVVDTNVSYFHNHVFSINHSSKNLAQVKQSFKSKYFFYTQYEHIGFFKRALLKGLIVYGLFSRKLLYKIREIKRNFG